MSPCGPRPLIHQKVFCYHSPSHHGALFCEPKLWELVTIAIIFRPTDTRLTEPQVANVCWVYVYKIGINEGHEDITPSPNKILPHWGNLSRLAPLHKPIIFELSEWKRCESKVSLELFYPSSSENNGVSQRLALMTPLFFIYILKWIWWLWFIFNLLPRPLDHHIGYTRLYKITKPPSQ